MVSEAAEVLRDGGSKLGQSLVREDQIAQIVFPALCRAIGVRKNSRRVRHRQVDEGEADVFVLNEQLRFLEDALVVILVALIGRGMVPRILNLGHEGQSVARILNLLRWLERWLKRPPCANSW